MAAGVPESSSCLIQESSISEVSREPGGVSKSSIHVLSTQVSARADEEAQPFLTRAWAVVLVTMTQVWHFIKSLFSKATPESNQITPEKALAHYVIAIKNTHLTIRERVEAFSELLSASCFLLSPWTEPDFVALQTQIQIGCNELPPGFKKEVYQRLSRSMTDQLVIDAEDDIYAIQDAFTPIVQGLPSNELARLRSSFNGRKTDIGKVRVLVDFNMIQFELSKLEPDITVEILKTSVLDLFETLGDLVKSEIYTEVQKVALQESRSSNESEAYIDIKGIRVNVQNDSLGQMIVNADPLGLKVQLGMKKWLEGVLKQCSHSHLLQELGRHFKE